MLSDIDKAAGLATGIGKFFQGADLRRSAVSHYFCDLAGGKNLIKSAQLFKKTKFCEDFFLIN